MFIEEIENVQSWGISGNTVGSFVISMLIYQYRLNSKHSNVLNTSDTLTRLVMSYIPYKGCIWSTLLLHTLQYQACFDGISHICWNQRWKKTFAWIFTGHTGPLIMMCRLDFGPKIVYTWILCMRDITMKCLKSKLSSHARRTFAKYHSSLLETVEHGVAALGRLTLCVKIPNLSIVGVPFKSTETRPVSQYSHCTW